ncbi:MAG: helix-turn-helix domain-containing protein [Pseudoxanthomonas sp.]
MLVQKLRLQRGWSQQQLAELSGLSVRTIQRVENGHLPSVETLKSLASVFEIEFSRLSSEDTTMNNSTVDTNTDSAVNTVASLREHEETLAFNHVRKLKVFYKHLLVYAVVMGSWAVFNWYHMPYAWVGWTYWPNWSRVVWPALAWGFGLLIWATNLFDLLPFLGPAWEKRQVEKRLGRPL